MDNEFNYQSLSDRVVNYLKEQIFLKNYRSGERILESKIAEQLDISRAPVREAIKELEKQGLITSIPRKGSYVVDFTREDIKEIYDIRILLESRVMERLISDERLGESDFHKLTEIIEEMIGIAERETIDADSKIIAMNKKDMEFHKYLWKKSGRRWTINILTTLHYQLQFAMIIDLEMEENLKESAEEHYKILNALKMGNLEQAKEGLINHIVSYNEEIMEIITTL